MDIDSYFQHIGLTKPTNCSLQVLNELHKHHLLTIPFENLDIINGIPLSMDPELIMNKILDNNRGGICFETNTIFSKILLELGFTVQHVSARFWNNEKQTWNPEFSHLALIVSIDQLNYLADVGVGGGFIEPILLENQYEYTDANGTYRVIENTNTTYILQILEERMWKDFLFISLDSKELEQFSEQFHYYQTSNETIFTKNKIVNLLKPDGRISLSDHQLKITKKNKVTIFNFETEEEWQQLYSKIFQPSIKK